jgi:uncharacterized radical SAM superfamily Fe-S cluster-containing enzyme
METDHLDKTKSFCPQCLRLIPATIREDPLGVVMDRICPDHGRFFDIVSSDAATYGAIRQMDRKVTPPANRATDHGKGCPYDCGLCPSHDQHTCLAILEITSRCNLGCPVCLADSRPTGVDLDLSTIDHMLRALLESEGKPTPLQISGGEPTLHAGLEEIIQKAVFLGFDDIELDTNGLALGKDPTFAEKLKDAGLSQVYLQMDGLSGSVSEFIRGRDITLDKIRALENFKNAGLEVGLSVTVVPGINDDILWEMIRFGMDQGVKGVSFQTVSLCGRFPESLQKSRDRMTIGHFMHKVQEQSMSKILPGDILPVPCPDPRCSAVMYALIDKGELIPLNRLTKSSELLDIYADIPNWSDLFPHLDSKQIQADSISNSCCESSSAMERILSGADCFSIGFHGMMDAYSFDIDRAKRCCVHALVPDGRLIPFCLYNIKYRNNDIQTSASI